MNLDRMTTRLRDAVVSAVESARAAGHPEVVPAHLVKALLVAEGSTMVELLRRAGGESAGLGAVADRELAKLPKTTGGNAQMSRDLAALMEEAEKRKHARGDGFLATEHVVLALAAG